MIQSLSIDGNGISTLPDLSSWTNYWLRPTSENLLSDMPQGFPEFVSLKNTELAVIKSRLLPTKLTSMENLTSLNLANNPLRDRNTCDTASSATALPPAPLRSYQSSEPRTSIDCNCEANGRSEHSFTFYQLSEAHQTASQAYPEPTRPSDYRTPRRPALHPQAPPTVASTPQRCVYQVETYLACLACQREYILGRLCRRNCCRRQCGMLDSGRSPGLGRLRSE